jgi:cytochrome P450 family 135
VKGLPPGPRSSAAAQTVEWIVRPTAFLRRAQARYGEPFTVRTAYWDAPLVLTSDPEQIRRIYAAPPELLQGGDSSAFMEPFTGRNSVLILSGEEHLRQRRLMLPPFHGEALRRWTRTIAEIADAELDTWVPGTPIRALDRMQALTLEVIQRVIFGSRDPELRDALREALDMTGSTANLVTMSLVRRDFGPYARFMRAVERIDTLVYARIDDAQPDTPEEAHSILDLLKASGATRAELRDQLVTLLAAGHETTATALAWALERLARHPDTPTHSDAHLDAVVKETLRTRPVLSITARRALEPYTLQGVTVPAGAYVAACPYLAHRRAGTAFAPERWLGADEDGGAPKPEPYAYIPFGGGTRRCLGAAFAALEMREVLRAVTTRFTLRPDRPAPERMRRRSIVLAPSRGAAIVPLTR